jgi:hypothetical protein
MLSEAFMNSYSTTIDIDLFYNALKDLKRILPSRKSDYPVHQTDAVQINMERDVRVWGRDDDIIVDYLFLEDRDVVDTCDRTYQVSVPVRDMLKPVQKIRKNSDTITLDVNTKQGTLHVETECATFDIDVAYHGKDGPKGLSFFQAQGGAKRRISDIQRMEGLTLAARPEADKRQFLRDVLIRPQDDETVLLASDGSITAMDALDDVWERSWTVQAESIERMVNMFDKGHATCQEGGEALTFAQGKAHVHLQPTDRSYPPIEHKREEWSRQDERESIQGKRLYEGVDFMESMESGQKSIRFVCENDELRLKSGISSSQRNTYTIKKGVESFPHAQIQRTYLLDVARYTRRQDVMLDVSRDDEHPISISGDHTTWFILKYS